MWCEQLTWYRIFSIRPKIVVQKQQPKIKRSRWFQVSTESHLFAVRLYMFCFQLLFCTFNLPYLIHCVCICKWVNRKRLSFQIDFYFSFCLCRNQSIQLIVIIFVFRFYVSSASKWTKLSEWRSDRAMNVSEKGIRFINERRRKPVKKNCGHHYPSRCKCVCHRQRFDSKRRWHIHFRASELRHICVAWFDIRLQIKLVASVEMVFSLIDSVYLASVFVELKQHHEQWMNDEWLTHCVTVMNDYPVMRSHRKTTFHFPNVTDDVQFHSIVWFLFYFRSHTYTRSSIYLMKLEFNCYLFTAFFTFAHFTVHEPTPKDKIHAYPS